MIHITIPGNPIAQARPRFANGRAYETECCRDYKELVRIEARYQMHKQGATAIDGPLWLSLKIYREIPKSWPIKRKQAALEGRIRPTVKPDVSNYLKGIEDALNGICYKDDSQIVEYREPFGKWYGVPRVEVVIGEVAASTAERKE